MYCNVTDAWTLADKWKRIIISFAGIFVELVIAAAATFVWWYTPQYPVVNNIALCVMVLCSVSTVVFNANPLMKFDGYYILADWLEVPNLREKSNKYLNNLFLAKSLGVEVPPEPYMVPWRKWLFVFYAIFSWIYRWVVMFGILWFLSDFMGPKLKVLSQILAVVCLLSMFIWPAYRVVKNVRQRGRLPDMKAKRVYVTLAIVGGLLAAVFLVPLPVSRVRETGLVVVEVVSSDDVRLTDPARLEVPPGAPAGSRALEVRPGQRVRKGDVLGRFVSPQLDVKLGNAQRQSDLQWETVKQLAAARDEAKKRNAEDAVKQYDKEIADARREAQAADQLLRTLTQQRGELNALRAPREGVVLATPSPNDVGKLFDVGNGARPSSPSATRVGSTFACRLARRTTGFSRRTWTHAEN